MPGTDQALNELLATIITICKSSCGRFQDTGLLSLDPHFLNPKSSHWRRLFQPLTHFLTLLCGARGHRALLSAALGAQGSLTAQASTLMLAPWLV